MPRAARHPILFKRLAPLLLAAHAALAQQNVDRFKVSAGGGTSTQGAWSVRGAIGQADAGTRLNGGPYSISGGAWAFPILIQTPGAPTLRVTNSVPGFATLWWTPAATGFILQFSDRMPSTNWVNAPSGTNNPAVVPTTPPARFYRLFRP